MGLGLGFRVGLELGLGFRVRVGFRVRGKGLGLGLCHFLNPPVGRIQTHHIVPLSESSRREDSDASYCAII